MSGSIEVFGRATSSNVQTVMWTLGELELSHVRHDVGGAFGGTDTSEYRAMNPMGLVPAYKDDDVTLFECAAIVRYLGARHGDDRFWPSDPVKRARLDMIAEWGKNTFTNAITYKVFWQLVRVPAAERNQAIIDDGVQELSRLTEIFEGFLGSNSFIGGETVCFADIMVGFGLYRYFELEFPRAKRPKLDAYYKRLTERSAYRDHVMIDFSSLRVE